MVSYGEVIDSSMRGALKRIGTICGSHTPVFGDGLQAGTVVAHDFL